MEEKRVADYFVVVGGPANPEPLNEFVNEDSLKPDYKQDPIVDLCVIIRSLGENIPEGYKCLEYTPTGFPADLNHGSIRAPELYLCYRRGRDKPPIMDIGVLYEGKERVKSGCEVLYTTPQGKSANVNNGTSRIYITFRRAESTASFDTLAVTDVCVILTNKSEVPPHAFNQIDKNLNKGMMGSDVYLCYKKSMTKLHTIAYKPAILSRYPLEDNPSYALPESVPMFCLPLGASVESCPAGAKRPRPVFSTFVLTGKDGEKIYGAAVMFYEPYPSERLDETAIEQLGMLKENGEQVPDMMAWQTKCICLLSQYPFFSTFKKFLRHLYKLLLSGPHNVPIERYVSHFMMEVPFPSAQRPRILIQLTNDVIPLAQREESPLPESGASFIKLLRNLGPEDCLNILLMALLEQKILIHSLRPDVLTSVAEALISILFPFHWECPYIPLCPLGLSDVLNAPIPFIVGVDSRYFDMYDPPPDVNCVDLDTHTITYSDHVDRKNLNYKMLPKKAAKMLKSNLEKLFEKVCQETSVSQEAPEDRPVDLSAIDTDFKKYKKEVALESSIQEAFLRFTAMTLKGYEKHLKPITNAPTERATDVGCLFDVQGFLKSRDKAYHRFFSQLMKTQLFSRFIEIRSFASDKDVGLAFFDECTEKVDEYNPDVRLIEQDELQKSERTVFIYPPEPIGLPEGAEYSYTSFPELNPDLFLPKTTQPSLVTPIKQTNCPNSPMTKRTKQEVKSAQKVAARHAKNPSAWTKCLLSHCYSLWFIHLPAYLKSVRSKTKALHLAYDVLVKMQQAQLEPPDEVCYRVLMQLCGLYHQPALAVKVLSQLKSNGVMPNAITYGFYNKVVLESKWPSSNLNAVLMWTKLRNVIMATAQFKQALRGRRLSLYSTSESDFDRISRTSTDSFVEESSHYAGKATEFVNDLVHVESPNNEEKISTGGMSDRGYSSMTLDEAGKRSSMVIGSQDSLDSINRLKILGKEERTIVMNGNRGDSAKQSQDKKVKKRLDFPPVDVKGEKTNQIVKKSLGTNGSDSTLRGSAHGSQAGLLMTSQTALDQSMFGELGLSHSLIKPDLMRKRHSSEETQRRRSTPESQSAKLIGRISEDRHSCTAAINGHIEEDDNCSEEEEGDETPSATLDLSAFEETIRNDPQPTAQDCQIKVEDALNHDIEALQNALSDLSTTSATDAEIKDDNKLNPNMLSPSHSVRTPVTENDPLGLFNVDSLQLAPTSGVMSSPSKKTNIAGVDELLGLSQTEQPAVPRTNLLVELEQFSSTPGSPSKTSVDSSVSREKSNSLTSTSDASSPSSPEKWSPLSHSQPGATDASSSGQDTTSTSSSSSATSQASSTRKGKPIARGDSFSSAMRSAASFAKAFSSRFHDLKNNMSPSAGHSKQQSSSRSSISSEDSQRSSGSAAADLGTASSVTVEKVIEEDEGEGIQRTPEADRTLQADEQSANQTPLSLSTTPKALHSSHDLLDAKTPAKYSSPLVSTLMGGLKDSLPYLQGLANSSLQGLQYSLDSLKGAYSNATVASYTSSTDSDGSETSSMRGVEGLSGSMSSLPHTLYNYAMEVEICTLSKCPSCSALLYDEEIMAGWSADDSVLITSCQFCYTKLVPQLWVYVKDLRHCNRPLHLTPSQSSESMQSIQSMPNFSSVSNCLSVPDHKHHHTPGLHRSSLSLVSADHILLRPHHSRPEFTSENKMAPTTNQDQQPPPSTPSQKSIPEEKLIEFSPTHERKEPEEPTQNAENTATADATVTDAVTDSETANGVLIPSVPKPSLPWQPTADGSGDAPSIANGGQDEPEQSITELNGTFTDPSASSAETNAGQGDGAGEPSKVTFSLTPESPEVVSVVAEEGGKMSLQETAERRAIIEMEPVTVPYLSPLVLRKEVENVVEQEGDLCLQHANFVDLHPIIYWNLVYYFKRIDVPSHLPGFVLTAKSTNKATTPPPECWQCADSRHVLIRPVWDNLRISKDYGVPMYANWNTAFPHSTSVDALAAEAALFNKSIMKKITDLIKSSNVIDPIRLIIEERNKERKATGRTRFHSIYREILFLSFVALERQNIDQNAFDREYTIAFEELHPKERAQTRPNDRPPKRQTVVFRHRFSELELIVPSCSS